jgi:hypothetical protein
VFSIGARAALQIADACPFPPVNALESKSVDPRQGHPNVTGN